MHLLCQVRYIRWIVIREFLHTINRCFRFQYTDIIGSSFDIYIIILDGRIEWWQRNIFTSVEPTFTEIHIERQYGSITVIILVSIVFLHKSASSGAVILQCFRGSFRSSKEIAHTTYTVRYDIVRTLSDDIRSVRLNISILDMFQIAIQTVAISYIKLVVHEQYNFLIGWYVNLVVLCNIVIIYNKDLKVVIFTKFQSLAIIIAIKLHYKLYTIIHKLKWLNMCVIITYSSINGIVLYQHLTDYILDITTLYQITECSDFIIRENIRIDTVVDSHVLHSVIVWRWVCIFCEESLLLVITSDEFIYVQRGITVEVNTIRRPNDIRLWNNRWNQRTVFHIIEFSKEVITFLYRLWIYKIIQLVCVRVRGADNHIGCCRQTVVEHLYNACYSINTASVVIYSISDYNEFVTTELVKRSLVDTIYGILSDTHIIRWINLEYFTFLYRKRVRSIYTNLLFEVDGHINVFYRIDTHHTQRSRFWRM